jgi:NADPH:quinone reductase-like Zn-dependent oxidoreductase
MRAVVYDRYGPPEVLRIDEVERPAPKDDEVLIKIAAVAVTRADVHTREANRKAGPVIMLISQAVSGFGHPRQPILGSELAGDVAEIGGTVTDFKVGDRVFVSSGFAFGGYAEYTCVRQSGRIARIPKAMTYVDAAPVGDGGLNALWCLRFAELKPGKSVLVYGASGAIGTAGVQLAKHFGAEVTAVCSTKNLGLMKTLGADHAIDYTKEDFTKNGETYHVIFDAVGKHSFRRSRASLKSPGMYLATDGFENLLRSMWNERFGARKVIFRLPPRYTRADIEMLRDLMEKGEFHAVIDRTYPLDQVVEASRYVESEQKTGNVVLTVS